MAPGLVPGVCGSGYNREQVTGCRGARTHGGGGKGHRLQVGGPGAHLEAPGTRGPLLHLGTRCPRVHR